MSTGASHAGFGIDYLYVGYPYHSSTPTRVGGAATYGNYRQPVSLGSGGGTNAAYYDSPGGNGGG